MTESITIAGGSRGPAHQGEATGSRTDGAGRRRAGPGNAARRPGNLVRVLVAGGDTGGRLALVETRAVRGCEPPRHIHRREDEIVYVLAGVVTFWVGGARHHTAAGACLVLPRDIEHGYAVESGEATLLSLSIRPAWKAASRNSASPPGTPISNGW